MVSPCADREESPCHGCWRDVITVRPSTELATVVSAPAVDGSRALQPAGVLTAHGYRVKCKTSDDYGCIASEYGIVSQQVDVLENNRNHIPTTPAEDSRRRSRACLH